jgi:hypothetical protein
MATRILWMQENLFLNASEGFVLSRDTDGAAANNNNNNYNNNNNNNYYYYYLSLVLTTLEATFRLMLCCYRG